MNKKVLSLALLALLFLTMAAVAVANPVLAAGRTTLTFDVAEAGTRFIFDEAPVFDDGFPAYGNPFVTEGYLYPEGTLSCNEDGCNGVLANGEPEFPDMVLGKWVCRGYMIGDGAHTETGAWVISTQTYQVDDDIIVTEGFELVDIGVEGSRAITGGTGPYDRARGEMAQTLLGFNETMGVTLNVTLAVKK